MLIHLVTHYEHIEDVFSVGKGEVLLEGGGRYVGLKKYIIDFFN